MAFRRITLKRASIVIVTATFVIFLTETFSSTEQFALDMIFSGAVYQDDPLLISYAKKTLNPPSKLPYNINNIFSGIFEKEKTEKFFFPSQDFIISKVEEILGDSIENGGTFLEAGAFDGVFLSNTLFLEYSYGWKGILAEPYPVFYKKLLARHRKTWSINACLSDKPWAKKEFFIPVSDNSTNHLINGLVTNSSIENELNKGSSHLAKYYQGKNSGNEKMVEVQCLPLYTIMKAVGMTHIDFLSLDVQGAEMGILRTIPWDKVSFSIMAIEHGSPEDLRAYLRPKGYIHSESQAEDHIFVWDKSGLPVMGHAGVHASLPKGFSTGGESTLQNANDVPQGKNVVEKSSKLRRLQENKNKKWEKYFEV